MEKALTTAFSTRLAKAHHCLAKKQRVEAKEHLDFLLAQSSASESVAVLLSMGDLCFQLDEYAQAVFYYGKVVQAEPKNPAHLVLLGTAHLSLKQYAQAEQILLQALALDPCHAGALSALGSLYWALDQHEKSARLLEDALQYRPNDPVALSNLAVCLNAMGETDKAITYAKKAARHDPKNANNYYTLGSVLLKRGEVSAAVREFERCIQLQPAMGMAYEQLSRAKKFTRDDVGFIERAENMLAESMPAQSKCRLYFSVAKMYDDIGEYDKAFKYFKQANILGRDAIKPDNDKKFLQYQKKLCSKKNFQYMQEKGSQSELPVFIVGMPRSGTTLVEQIVASHPAAAGAGELLDINNISVGWFEAAAKSAWWRRRNLPDQSVIDECISSYLGVLSAKRQSALRVTDKMPGNYMFLGIIALLFPRARIIHVVRHPLDTCLSCYFQAFPSQPWTYDLQWLAELYRRYRDTMSHWKTVLPQGMITEISYEDLIANPESQSKRLIAACGLEWDERCLDFANTQREVNTASLWQVRQPIYQSSKMRWIKYAPYIGELANALADYLQDDIELLKEHGIQIKRK